ncbi:hypothetical protein IFM89_022491 [Coptis chinensis]|uniref:Uncharacterized protein n=1 Tax=Coptis chinensis TaxID=261450 RepID=A0A835IE44_9MAGN|nr:hypothetical protein IFM89_022491 [Coptis chinensis]
MPMQRKKIRGAKKRKAGVNPEINKADPPDPSKIRQEDIIGVTIERRTSPKVLIDRIQRNILGDKPRVTKFPINFHPKPMRTEGAGPFTDRPAENIESGEHPPSPDHASDEA